MHIREFSINRFGMLVSQHVPHLSNGITVFYGENEAGKSTCLNFFRAMLFGYARNRRSIDYLTDAKALSGGSLLLESGSLGPVRLARIPGPHGGKVTLTNADGTPRPESDLAILLRGCTPDLFDKVFAFSLGELMQFSSLTDDSIRHALHGAAFGTGLRSPGQVLRQLEEAMRQIFAPRASTSKIHGLLRNFDAINATIKERGNEVDRYALLHAELEAASRELQASQTTRLAMETERRRLERAIALRSRWNSLREAEDHLAAFQAMDGTFTPDGRERLDRLTERLEDRRQRLAQAKFTLERAEQELASQAFDPTLASAAGKVQTLSERKERMRAASAEAQTLRAEQQSLLRQITAICADLGPEWKVDALARADLSLAVHEQCEALGKHQSAAAQSLATAQTEVDRLGRERLAAREAWDEALAALQKLGDDTTAPADTAAMDAGPDDDTLERLGQLLVRSEDAHERTGPLALTVHNADRALDAAIATIDAGWSRQDADLVVLPPADRERLLGIARTVGEAETQETERERDMKAAALIRDDIAERVAMLKKSMTERADRLFGNAYGNASSPLDSTTLPLETATAYIDRSRRVLRRAQTARKIMESARTAYDTANEQIGDIASLMRAARPKNAFPWGTAILFLAVLCVVCGGGILYLGLAGGQQVLSFAGSGALASGIALGLAWLALFTRSGADAAVEIMERNWSAIEQRLIRTRIAAQDTRLEAENTLAALLAEAPDVFPGNATDAESLAEAEQILSEQREHLIILERDAKDSERETLALGAAQKRLESAEAALRDAAAHLQTSHDAWKDTLYTARLPLSAQARDARSLLERLDAVAVCRASLRAKLSEQQAAEKTLAECLCFARSLPELADMFASLPEPGSHLAPDPGPWLTLVRDFLARQRHLGRERIRLRELAAMRRARLDELTALESHAKENRNAADLAFRDAEGSWRAWLVAQQFSTSLSPETARRALETAGKARAALETSQRTTARLNAIGQEATAFLDDLAELALLAPDKEAKTHVISLARPAQSMTGEGTELPVVVDASLMASALAFLDELALLSREAGEKAAIVRAGEKELPSLHDAVTLTQNQVDATMMAMEEILRLAHCASPEEYRSAHAVWEQREAAFVARRTTLAAFEREAADAGISVEDAAATFSATAPEETAAALTAKETALSECLAHEHTLATRKGSLENAMAGLLNEKGLTAMLAEREALASAIRTAAIEWSRLSVAREMLLAAKGRFESERQGGVVHYAGEIFNSITGDAYSGITVSLTDESVAAVMREGGEKNPETELSRGTREQLYLALRLAYILDHGTQAEKLPVIMDDILVNFDDNRARKTALALASFARNHQILFFTCHEKTATMLAEAAPDTSLYALRNGTFVDMSLPLP